MIVFFEGLILSFWLLLICVVGIAKDGPVGLVVLYEQEVQDRVVEMGGDTYRFSGIGSDYFRGYNSVDVADVFSYRYIEMNETAGGNIPFP